MLNNCKNCIHGRMQVPELALSLPLFLSTSWILNVNFRLMQDQTQTDLINLRRTIYLTIMSSAQFEEAGHKLMKIKLAQGQEIEVVTMLIECCSQEKTYIR